MLHASDVGDMAVSFEMFIIQLSLISPEQK